MKLTVQDVKRATRQRSKVSVRATLDRAVAEAGLGTIVIGLLALALLIFSLTPAYQGEEMAIYRSGIRCFGIICAFGAGILIWFHRAHNV